MRHLTYSELRLELKVLPLTKMDAAPALSASMLGLELHSWIADRKGICQGDQVTLCDVVARAAKESRLRNAWSWVEQFPHGLILAEVQPRTSGFIITQSKNDQRTDCQVSLQVRATLPATGGAKFCIMLGAKLSKGVKHLQCLGERGAAGEAGKTLAEEVLTRMTFGSGREAQMVKREDALHAESSAKHGCGLIQADPERVPSKKMHAQPQAMPIEQPALLCKVQLFGRGSTAARAPVCLNPV